MAVKPKDRKDTAKIKGSTSWWGITKSGCTYASLYVRSTYNQVLSQYSRHRIKACEINPQRWCVKGYSFMYQYCYDLWWNIDMHMMCKYLRHTIKSNKWYTLHMIQLITATMGMQMP